MNWTPEEILNIRVLHQGECLSRLDGSVAFIPDRIVFTYKDKVLTLDEVPYPVLEAVHNILNSEKCEDSGYADSRCCICHKPVDAEDIRQIDRVPRTIFTKSECLGENSTALRNLCDDAIRSLAANDAEGMWDNLLNFIRENYCYYTLGYLINGKDITLNLEKMLQIVSEQTPAETLDYFKSMREAITK